MDEEVMVYRLCTEKRVGSKNSPPDSPVLKRTRVQSGPAGSTTARWLSLLSSRFHDFERRRNDVKVTMDWVGDHSSALRNGAEFLCPSANLDLSRCLVLGNSDKPECANRQARYKRCRSADFRIIARRFPTDSDDI